MFDYLGDFLKQEKITQKLCISFMQADWKTKIWQK